MTGDFIDIEDLTVRTVIGIFDEERTRLQDVVLSIRLYADCRAAGATDDIGQALDYKKIAKRVIALTRESRFLLIERLAAVLAATLLAEFAVDRVRIRVEKPGALRHARTVAVTIERSRSSP